jgi:signal transduction histidine kinase
VFCLNEELAQVFSAMDSGVLLVDPVNQTVVWTNQMVATWLGGEEATPESVQGLLEAKLSWLMLPPKTDCLVCQGKGKEAVSVHGATVQNQNGEQVRYKIKHHFLTSLGENGMMLLLMDPFSEDMALTQAHSDFVSTVSHEFRTPLTSIKGFADTLLRYGAQLGPDQQKRFITIIKDQADRLTRLVENLLTVSKLGASRMEMSYRAVGVKKVVDRVVQNIIAKGGVDKASAGLPDAGRKFEIEIPDNLPDVWVDGDKFEQIMLNLIDNAVKYSFPGSQVLVVAHLFETDPDRLQIRVQDQGVGIPEEHLPRIFTKFSRIDNPLTREVEGTGLGLYITQSLTKTMGGNIRLESVVNQGTTFVLDFPVATAERQAAARQMQPTDFTSSHASASATFGGEAPKP